MELEPELLDEVLPLPEVLSPDDEELLELDDEELEEDDEELLDEDDEEELLEELVPLVPEELDDELEVEEAPAAAAAVMAPKPPGLGPASTRMLPPP